ncbi:thiosulfate sulfertansferase, putative, partial [Perkinsus marinus ATCC 50983]
YVDASWYLNNPNRNADDDYKMRRIPGAIRFDIDTIRDTSNEHLSSLPHMLPSPSTINKWLHDNKDRLVVYTHPGSFAGPRVWWIFTLYGLNTV